MMYNYDKYGWLTTNPLFVTRTTSVVPQKTTPPVVGEFYPRWSGSTWLLDAYVEPEAEPEPIPEPEDPRLWWIDVGPFKDRLGMDTLAIAASTHPVCLGVKEMLYDRKYIDLKDARVAQLLDILIATAQPAASAYFPGSGPMTEIKKDIILNTPTTANERFIKELE